jgi:hypothetical protein
MPSTPTSVAVSKPRPQRIHVPALADHPEHGAEELGQQPAAVEQQVEVFVDVGLAATHTGEGLVDRPQHHEIDEPDREEEERRNQRANEASDGMEASDALLQRSRRGRKCDRADDDDR